MSGSWAQYGRSEPTHTRVWTGPVPVLTPAESAVMRPTVYPAAPPRWAPTPPPTPPTRIPSGPVSSGPRPEKPRPRRWVLPVAVATLSVMVAAAVAVLIGVPTATAGRATIDPAQSSGHSPHPTSGGPASSEPPVRQFPEPAVGGKGAAAEDPETGAAESAGGRTEAQNAATDWIAAFNELDGAAVRRLSCAAVRGMFTDKFIARFDAGSFVLDDVTVTDAAGSMTFRYTRQGTAGSSTLPLVVENGSWLVCG